MKPDFVWIHPTKASPACRYSFDASKGKLVNDRPIFSDCGMWKTYYHDRLVVLEPGSLCPHCAVGRKLAVPTTQGPARKTRAQPPVRYLYHNA